MATHDTDIIPSHPMPCHAMRAPRKEGVRWACCLLGRKGPNRGADTYDVCNGLIGIKKGIEVA